jgi:DNA alkylation repair enzyme
VSTVDAVGVDLAGRPIRPRPRSFGASSRRDRGYAEGDRFLGVTVPKQRVIARNYALALSLPDIETLLHRPIHEEGLTAVLGVRTSAAELPPKGASREWHVVHVHVVGVRVLDDG